MHLSVRLPQVHPDQIAIPTHCPLKRKNGHICTGTRFKLHQGVCRKPLRDTHYPRVVCHRYRCLKCHRAFRVYPGGVSHLHQSATLQALSVLLYILGLSYQGVADLLESLGQPLAKATVFNNVQAAGRRAQALRRSWLATQVGVVPVLGLDLTHVKCNRQDTILAVATAVLTGQPLTFDVLPAETSLHVETWIRELACTLGAEVLVTDDADGLKIVADHLGLQQQICRAHVNRNIHDLIAQLGTRTLEHPDPVPWELPEASVDQFREDLDTVEWVIKSLPADGQAQLSALATRYQGAPPPAQGHRASMWYRMRRLTLDWSENWARLSLFQRWRGAHHEKLDGTNNGTEQVIGQCAKERYRTMRGYKRQESILNVTSLIGWVRANGPDYDMTELVPT